MIPFGSAISETRAPKQSHASSNRLVDIPRGLYILLLTMADQRRSRRGTIQQVTSSRRGRLAISTPEV